MLNLLVPEPLIRPINFDKQFSAVKINEQTRPIPCNALRAERFGVLGFLKMTDSNRPFRAYPSYKER